MLDFTRIDQARLDDVSIVVGELVNVAGVDVERIMLVGAHCRDILHDALGHSGENRVTRDLDFAIALSDWGTFQQVEQAFHRIGSNGIRYRISGLPVDVMPFGSPIEDPSGIATPSARDEEMVVFGFEDVFERALKIELPACGSSIKIPSPAGYAALKVRAWIDRSQYGEYKDAEDLATVLRWYEDWDEVADRLYGDDSQIIDLYAYDVRLAAAHLLGIDVRNQLTPSNADDLATRFYQSDRQQFSVSLGAGGHVAGRREEWVSALAVGLGCGPAVGLE